MSTRFKSLKLLTLVALLAVEIGPAATNGSAVDVGKWKRFEVAYSNGVWSEANVYDVEFSGTFTHVTSGRRFTQLGFYAGGNTFKIFFMPDALGEWTFETSCTDPAAAENLDGRTGSFTCVPSGLPGRLEGAPDNRWNLSDAGRDAPMIIGVFQYFKGTETQNGVDNMIDWIRETAGGRIIGQVFAMLSFPQEVVPYVKGQEGDEFYLPYWDRLNSHFDYMRDRGMGQYLMIYGDDEDTPTRYGISAYSEKEVRLFRYLVARLAPYPMVLWDTGIDIIEYRTESWIDWFTDWFNANDPYGHFVGSRSGGGSGDYHPPEGTYFSDGTRYPPRFNTVLEALDTRDVPTAFTDKFREKNDDYTGANPRFEPEVLIRAAWEVGLAGGTCVYISDDEDNGHLGSHYATEFHTGPYLGYRTDYFRDRIQDFDSLDPHQELIVSGDNREIGVAANPGSEYLAYVRNGYDDRDFKLNLAHASGMLNVSWYCPQTNSFASGSSVQAGSSVTFNAPSSGDYVDWVLHLTADVTGNLPPDAPTNLTATDPTATTIDLDWTHSTDDNTPPGSMQYRVVYTWGTSADSTGYQTGNSRQLTGLIPETTYTIRVRARDTGGLISPLSLPAVASTLPSANDPPNDPTNVAASALGQTAIRITWTDNGDPDGDNVSYYVREVSDNGINSGWLGVGVHSWDATGLAPGTTYVFEVRGRDDGWPQQYSNWVRSNEETTDLPPNAPPDDPTNVVASSRGQTVIRITWTDNGDPDGDDVSYYIQEVSDHGINSGWLGVGVHSWDAAGLAPGTTYVFEVRGRDDGSPQEYSNWVQSNEETTDSPPTNDPPNDPTNVVATALGQTAIRITWTDNGDPDGDDVFYYVQEVSDHSISSGWLNAGVTTWDAEELTPGTTYTFEVRGRDDTLVPGHTAWVQSNAVSTEENRPPNAPEGVHARPKPPGTSEIRVVWNTASDPDGATEIEYQVHNLTRDTFSPWQPDTFFTDGGLSAGTEYRYEVRARDGDHAEGAFSAPSRPTRPISRPHEGFGAATVGGLNGSHVTVTTLADSGPGSLREALSGSDRYITFAVGGTIVLGSVIRVDTHHLTIDGATAPSPGISITCPDGSAIVFDESQPIAAHDIIMRHIRIENSGGDNLTIGGREDALATSNIVIDHCSLRGAGEGNLDIVDSAHEITVQWCVLGGNFRNQTIARSAKNISLHHNFYAESGESGPSVEDTEGATIDAVNNLIYGWGIHGTFWGGTPDPASGNLVRNYFIPADTSAFETAIVIASGASVYSLGNDVPDESDDAGTSTTRHGAPEVTELPARDALTAVLAEAGAQPRDADDAALAANAEADLENNPPDDTPDDTTPPARVTDLEVLEVETHRVRLGWHATGDDGMTGRASSYDLRFATEPLTEANFEDATPVSGLDAPREPGAIESATVEGLLAETTYHFALVVVDDEGNRSAVSEAVEALTLPGEELPEGPDEPPSTKFEEEGIVISWDESPDPSVIGYHVYRQPEGDTERRITDTPIAETRYVDARVIEGRAYLYRVTAVDVELNESPHSPATWIRATAGVPTAVTLDRVYPNPVRSEAVFQFGIPEVGPGHPEGVRVTIDLYDVAGHRMGRVVEGLFQPGVREVTWRVASSGLSFAPGMYLSVLRAGAQQVVKRIAIAG